MRRTRAPYGAFYACSTARLNSPLDLGYGHDGEMNEGLPYRVVQGGPGCPYLEERAARTTSALCCRARTSAGSSSATMSGNGIQPEKCGASEGECYKVTSDKFMPREEAAAAAERLRRRRRSSSNDKAGLIAGAAIARVVGPPPRGSVRSLPAAAARRRRPSRAARRRRRRRSPNPVVEKAPSRRAEPDEQLEFQGGELR